MNGRIQVKRNYQVRKNNQFEHISFETGVSQIPHDVFMNNKAMTKLWLLQCLRLDGVFANYEEVSPTLDNINMDNKEEVAKFVEKVEELKEKTFAEFVALTTTENSSLDTKFKGLRDEN